MAPWSLNMTSCIFHSPQTTHLIMNRLESVEHPQLEQGHGHWHGRVGTGGRSEVVLALGEMYVPFHAQTLLVHVAEVEEGLSATLLSSNPFNNG